MGNILPKKPIEYSNFAATPVSSVAHHGCYMHFRPDLDPRSPSNEVNRTPLQLPIDEATPSTLPADILPEFNFKNLIDPRSATREIERTPLVMRDKSSVMESPMASSPFTEPMPQELQIDADSSEYEDAVDDGVQSVKDEKQTLVMPKFTEKSFVLKKKSLRKKKTSLKMKAHVVQGSDENAQLESSVLKKHPLPAFQIDRLKSPKKRSPLTPVNKRNGSSLVLNGNGSMRVTNS